MDREGRLSVRSAAPGLDQGLGDRTSGIQRSTRVGTSAFRRSKIWRGYGASDLQCVALSLATSGKARRVGCMVDGGKSQV